MNRFRLVLSLAALLLGVAHMAPASDLTRPTIMGTHGMVSCGHWLAADAGATILKKGGNAFDAGVATVLAQSVLENNLFGFGGEVPILLYSAKEGKVYSVDGNMAAPKGVTIDWFKKNNIEMIPGDGLLAAGVCAVPDALVTALDKWGTMTFADVAADAIRLADEGFPMYNSFLNSIKDMEKRFRGEWPTSAAVYLPNGKVPKFGDIFVQKDLANTLKKLVEAEKSAKAAGGKNRSGALQAVRDRFYKGDIAEAIVKFNKENAFLDATGEKHYGNLTLEDFATYSVKLREPWTVNYMGYDVYKNGPWTQGPAYLQTLAILENFDIKKMGLNSADYVHLWIEASKLAHADRHQFYGDPDFVEVPQKGLLSKEYAKERAKLIDLTKASTKFIPGDAWQYNDKQPTKKVGFYPMADVSGTTGTRVVDAQGNMFSATPSGGWFTSSPIVAGLGFMLGSRAQMFDVDNIDSPRAYMPGKRPTTSLSPTLVLKNGKPFCILGTPGGDDQDQYTNQTLLNVILFGMEVQSAIDAPKVVTKHFPSLFYPHTANPAAMTVNPGISAEVVKELTARGHKVTVMKGVFTDATTMIMYNPDTKVISGGASPARDKQYVIGW